MSIKRKLMLIVLSIFFLLGMATKAEVEGVKEEAEKEVVKSEANPEMGMYEPLIKPSEEPALYKTKVNQVTPQSGITTGHVILYGHYIKPPYKFDIREDTLLFLNGVRIFPSLPSRIGLEEERRLHEKYKEASKIAEPHSDRLQALYDNSRELYRVIAPKEGKDVAVDSICKLLKRDSLIVDIKIVPEGKENILLEIKHYLPGYYMPPKPPATELVELRMYPPELPPPLSKKEKLERKKTNKGVRSCSLNF